MKFKSQININFANITRYLLFLPPFLLPLHLYNKVDCISYDKKRISNQKLQILMKFKSQININFANITRYLLFLPPFLLVITQLTVAKTRYGKYIVGMKTREGRSLAVYSQKQIANKQKKVENGAWELFVAFVDQGGLRFL